MALEMWIDGLIKGDEPVLPVARDAMMLNGLSVIDAIESHVHWRNKWFKALRLEDPNAKDAEKIACDHLCQVGQWIYSSGKVYEHLPEYADLKQRHAAFHVCASEAVNLHNKGEFLEAVALAMGPLSVSSKTVAVGFVNLFKASASKA
ncbi:CZB domain-containing protein [Vitreoscilla massiliensis]|uniref:CZB domain-containing protein n=1 Tax=Vitreoscilla massiliensis TaxID=1689272 RepID=A0ABY4E0S5_9NEIS|nr:CZB domain-containing protein [Vitreoscilla massiliensis]UOO89407.1 CZB domain-containing protein [Vitreoscilla massiliensis]